MSERKLESSLNVVSEDAPTCDWFGESLFFPSPGAPLHSFKGQLIFRDANEVGTRRDGGGVG